MECEPLSGNAGVSFFSTKWKLNIFNLQVFPYTDVKFSPSWFVFCPKARVSTEETVGRFEGGLRLISRSEVTNDNASEAFKDSSLFLALTLKTISTPFRRISLATVALASQVCLRLPSAHAQ